MKLYNVQHVNCEQDGYPVFVIRDGKIFRTVHHHMGWSEVPDYEIGTDGKVYRTEYNRLGQGGEPDFEFRKDQHLYRTQFHSEGPCAEPIYLLMD
ncbi:MAG: hypothetical protein JEZ11_25340 [Desulfobacterales bacterium]|nr:hypothetical protein [Desulfobacterales bacterium]